MLKTYYDESGIHKGAAYCFVGGALGDPQEWRALEESWHSLLAAYDVPYFHSTEFFARDPRGRQRGLYQGWTDGYAREFILNLTQVFLERKLSGINIGVDVGAFFERSRVERAFLTGGALMTRIESLLEGNRVVEQKIIPKKWKTSGKASQPFFLAFQYAVFRAQKLASRRGRKNHLIFDEQEQFKGWARKLLDHKNRLKSSGCHVDSLEFADKKEVPALQLADLVVNVFRRIYEKKADYREAFVHEKLRHRMPVGLIDAAVIRRALASLSSLILPT